MSQVVYNNSQLKYYSLITAECLRRDAIVSATADSFDYYFNNAWGYDEVRYKMHLYSTVVFSDIEGCRCRCMTLFLSQTGTPATLLLNVVV